MNSPDAKVLITGGSAGIGLAAAKLLLERGAKVAICGRDADRLARAEEQLPGVVALQGDVGDEADAKRLVGETVRLLGGYNALVNNAGFGKFGPLAAQDAGVMEAIFRTNVIGAMLMARESVPHFVEQDYGNILNVGSTAGDKGFAMGTAYAASKAAMKSMTESWRDELRTSNIRVMLIKPSEVVTEFAEAAGFPQEDSTKKLHAHDIAVAIVNALEQPDVGFIPEYPVWATNPKG